MKQEVLNYLFADRSYSGGVALYLSIPGANRAFANRLNRTGESPALLAQLHYELCKLGGIPEQMMKKILNSPLNAEAAIQAEAAPEAPASEAPEATEIPEEVNNIISLFRQYPFLQTEACPPELKQLVAAKVDAYYAFEAAHPKLFDAQTEEQLAEVATEVVENWLENKAIFDELNHFKATGSILGNHPIFALQADINEINTLSTGDLIKKRNATVKSVNTAKANIAKGDKPQLDDSRKQIIERGEFLLGVIDKAIEAKG